MTGIWINLFCHLYVDMLAEAEEEEDVSSSLQGWLVSLLCLSSPRKREKKKGQTHIHAFSLSLSLSATQSQPNDSQQARQGTAANQQIPSQTRTNPLYARSTLHENKIKKKKKNSTHQAGGRHPEEVRGRQRQTERHCRSLHACCFFTRYGCGRCLAI